MARGTFITFEGIDGSGKSTVAKRVARRLEARGVRTVLTCEPTKTWLGDAVKASYEKEVSPFTELLLFLADRATHTENIKGWLGEGRVVICDRYSDSTFAYQSVSLEGALRRVTSDPIRWLEDVSRPFVLRPDLTVLLAVDPSVSLERIRRKGTKFEKRGYLTKVAEAYMELARRDPKRFVVVDASKPLPEVLAVSLDAVLRVV